MQANLASKGVPLVRVEVEEADLAAADRERLVDGVEEAAARVAIGLARQAQAVRDDEELAVGDRVARDLGKAGRAELLEIEDFGGGAFAACDARARA